MANAPIRALDQSKEIRRDELLYDARPFWNKVGDRIKSSGDSAFILAFIAACPILSADLTTASLFGGLFYFMIFKLLRASSKKGDQYLPLRAPIQEKDYAEYKSLGQPHNGTGKPSGIFILGNERQNWKEMWISNTDAREHIWITGTTGSGKTEFILSMIMNCISWGSGFILIDGKGDVKTAIKVYRMLRQTGLTDNYLVLNFMIGGPTSVGGGLIGHTSNPFAFYSREDIQQVIQTMLPTASGDGAVWQQRATSMLSGVVTVLTWLRDFKGKKLTIMDIREGMLLENMTRMAVPPEVALPQYKDMPGEIKSEVLSYLKNLPNFPPELLSMPLNPQQQHPFAADPLMVPKYDNQTRTQHGFLTQQLSVPFNTLAESYRQIFAAKEGDVSMYDVVLNRRGLVVLLPALKKSLDEMANLGRIVTAMLKTVLGDALGGAIEGSLERVQNRRITNAPSPCLVIMDEVTYYIAKGLAMFPAQGRSLGFAFVFAVQSLTATFNRDNVEGRDAFGTVNTRITMFIADENETTKSVVESAGKGYAAVMNTYNQKQGLVTSYQNDDRLNIQEMERANIRDLTSQASGEFHYNAHGVLLRGRSIYIDDAHITNPNNDAKSDIHHGIRLTHFVSIPDESEEDLADRKALDCFTKLLRGNADILKPLLDNEISDEIRFMKDAYKTLDDVGKAEASIVGLMYIQAKIASSGDLAPQFQRGHQLGKHSPTDFNRNAAAGRGEKRSFAPRKPARGSRFGADDDDDFTMGGDPFADTSISDATKRTLEHLGEQRGDKNDMDLNTELMKKVISGAIDLDDEDIEQPIMPSRRPARSVASGKPQNAPIKPIEPTSGEAENSSDGQAKANVRDNNAQKPDKPPAEQQSKPSQTVDGDAKKESPTGAGESKTVELVPDTKNETELPVEADKVADIDPFAIDDDTAFEMSKFLSDVADGRGGLLAEDD